MSSRKNVRNNREFDSLSKEIEYQNLEIELFNKKIKEFNFLIEEKKLVIADSEVTFADRKTDLENKKAELDEIISDTQKEEEGLYKKSEKVEAIIEERLLTAYKRIRSNAHNGLAVVSGSERCLWRLFQSDTPTAANSTSNRGKK